MQPYCVSFLASQLQDATATSLQKLLTKMNFLTGSLFPAVQPIRKEYSNP